MSTLARPGPPDRPVRAQRSRVGVEIDGSRVSAVQVIDGLATTARVVTRATTAQALATVLDGLPAQVPVTITIASEAQTTARTSAPTCPLTRADLADLLAAHLAATPTADAALTSPAVTTAAVFRRPSGVGVRWSGLALGWPATLVSNVYTWAAANTTAPVRVIPTPVANAGAGPLVLALRETNSELTLAVGADAVATVHLRAGGLSIVEAVLGSGDAVGTARANEAIAHGGVRDPLAAGELDRWLREILDQVTATAHEWRAEGLAVPNDVFIYGRASHSAGLNLLLGDYGLRRALAPPAMARGMLKLPAAQRAEVTGAYLAATAPVGEGELLGDLATFDDPAARAALGARARRARRNRILLRATAGTCTALLLAAGPYTAARGIEAWHNARSASLTTQLAALVGADDPTTSTLVSALAAPPQPGINSAAAADVVAVGVPGLTVAALSAEPTDTGRTLVTITVAAPPSVTAAQLTAPWRAAGYGIAFVCSTPAALEQPATLTVGVLR